MPVQETKDIGKKLFYKKEIQEKRRIFKRCVILPLFL